jgi:hypothetical protein
MQLAQYAPAPPPHAMAPPASYQPARRPWWLLIVIAIGLLALVPAALGLLALRDAVDPEKTATDAEREVLRNSTLACPPPDRCSLSREERGLSYTFCTHKVPALTPYQVGDTVVTLPATRIGVITNVESASRRYLISFYGVAKEGTVSEGELAGRLCKTGVGAGPRGQAER